MSNTLVLYPSNWFYNAGVIGLLKVFERCGEEVENFLKDDGSVEIKSEIFKRIDVENFYFSENKLSSIVGKASIYRNYLQPSWKPIFKDFIVGLEKLTLQNVCDICGNGRYLDINIFNSHPKKDSIIKFIAGLRIFDVRLNNYLAPSKKFPNSFWNNDSSIVVCDLCGYILIHHHIPIIRLYDNSEIFINAPSFKIMWYLNKYAKIYEKDEIRDIRQILGMSLIELASKLYINLGKWEKMNIEVVCKYRERKNNKWEDKIDFFYLPVEVVDLLLDREIANILSEIGEVKILNKVLDGKFGEILEFGEKILKIGLKPYNERRKQEDNFINSEIRLERNRKALIKFAQNLFQLYALIEGKLKKEVYYEF
ncbi:MAG: hypothetical protein NZ845_05440 [Thermodesulfovibrio sp.]|nr:hypothetical protein [Thermodesulfovibrio sp.]